MHLGAAQQPQVRAKVADLFRAVPRPLGNELLALLHPLTVEVLKLAARCFADFLGAKPADVLWFSEPKCAQVELAGTRAVKRRLDRIWGGVATAMIEALDSASLLWPGPGFGQCLVLRGDVEVNHMPVVAYQHVEIPLGAEVAMSPGAQLLLRRSLIGSLYEVAQAAGLHVVDLIADAQGERRAYRTAAGLLELEQAGCRLSGRRIRLTVAETALLRRLAQSNGKVVAKSALASAAGIGMGRNVDHLAMGLRNKLGDGVIATVYGVGFALETRDPAQHAAPGL